MSDVPQVDPGGDPRWQAVRVLARNPAFLDPWTPAAATVEALEAAGLRIVHGSAFGVDRFRGYVLAPITDGGRDDH